MAPRTILILMLSFHLKSNICAEEFLENKTHVNQSNTWICCTDNYLWNESCGECLAAYGENCLTPCGQSTYGYCCKSTCHCTQSQVCDKYTGCIERDYKAEQYPDIILSLLIGLGSLSVSISLVFVGVMFCKWRIHMQRKFELGKENTGFQVNLLSCPGMEEGYAQTYDDVRESKMILNGGKSGLCDTGESKINSTIHAHLYNDKGVSKKLTREDQYNNIDACFRRDNTLVTLSEFPYDDCYVSVHNVKRLRRISKSCSDIKAVLEKPYINIMSSCNAKSTADNFNKNVLIERL